MVQAKTTRNKVVKLKDAGLGPAAIGRELGISRQRAWSVLHAKKRLNGEMLTPREVAKFLGVTADTVRGWGEKGMLKYYRLSPSRDMRFRRGDIEDFLRKRQAASPELLTPREVAKLLGLHISTVRRWSEKGVLKSYRLGPRQDRRFRREDIEDFVVKDGDMKTTITLQSDQLDKEDVRDLLQAIRLCERANFPDKEIRILVNVPELTIDETNEIFNSIKPPYKYGPAIFRKER